MAKPKSRRINRSGRKSLKKNRSRKSRSRKIRRNKRVGGDEILNAGFFPKLLAYSGEYIPAIGLCRIHEKQHIIKAVEQYSATDDKDKFEYKFSGCNADGTTSGGLTIINKSNILIYKNAYENLKKKLIQN